MKKLFAIGGLLLLALIIFVLWPRGTKPFPDADLRVVRQAVPAEGNAFFLLNQATNVADFSEQKREMISDLHRAKVWDSNRVAQVIADYEDALDLFEKALKLPHLQGPEIQTFGEEADYLSAWVTLARLATLKCKTIFLSGHEKEAFELAIQIVQFGHRVEDAGGTTVHYHLGRIAKQAAWGIIREMAGTTKLSLDDLQAFSTALSSYSANENGLTNVFKLEYKLQIDALKKLRAGSFPGVPMAKSEQIGMKLFGNVLLNEEKTQKSYATFARKQLAAIPTTWKDISTKPTPAQPMGTMADTMNLLLTGNPLGNVLTGMTLSSLENFLRGKCRENVDWAATRAILALRCYQMKNGHPPGSLRELVPDFLPSVPLDDFDGEPLRFVPEKRVIYSVGGDLIDSGGQEKDAKGEHSDVVFPLGF